MTGLEKDEKINAALLKVALGCRVAEVTEEYAEVDGTLKLTKRKKTKKDIPPDLKAVQMLLSADGETTDLEQMTDEELKREKKRLLVLLKETEKDENAVKKTKKSSVKADKKKGE